MYALFFVWGGSGYNGAISEHRLVRRHIQVYGATRSHSLPLRYSDLCIETR